MAGTRRIWSDHTVPRLLDVRTRSDEIASGVRRILLRDGVEAVTVRRLATDVGLSSGSITHHLGSRAHVLRVACSRQLEWIAHDVTRRLPFEGPTAFLPDSESGLDDTRAWATWSGLATHDEGMAHVMLRDHGREYLQLHQLAATHEPHRSATALLVLLHGLRLAVSRQDPLTLAEARDLVADHVSRALPPQPPAAG